jgi:MarC family membrane protein
MLLPLQLLFHFIKEAPVGALGDDLLRGAPDHPYLVEAQGVEAHGVLGVVLPPVVIGGLLHGLKGVVVPLGKTFIHNEVGGGILLLLMAIAMLHARHSRIQQAPEETREAEEKESIAIVPLAIPLLAGPGAISTVIIYAHRATTWFETGFLLLATLVVAAAVRLALYLANGIGTALGKTGINIVTRLMGLILAAIAVEFIAAGVSHLLPGLAAGQ